MERKTKKEMSEGTVALFHSGYLRLSPDLLVGNPTSYFIRPYPEEKKLELQPATNGKKGPWAKRKLLWSNAMAKSPMISVKVALQYIGVELPKKSVEYQAQKQSDGTLVVQF